jgi:hypothetical protein
MLAALQGESIFIKALGGGGFWVASEQDKDIRMVFSGPAALGFLQIGGALTPSLKIFGFTGGVFAPSVNAKTENLKIETKYSFRTMHDFGIGLGYYLKSGLSLSLGLSHSTSYYKLEIYGKDGSTYTQEGWGSMLMLGQEFPISARTSFGLSAVGYYGRQRDGGSFAGVPIENFYAGLMMSLMYD